MSRRNARLVGIGLALFVSLCVAAWASNKFSDSKDASESDEPQKFLPDYDKLTKGREADWSYFPNGSLKAYKTVEVKEFDHNGKGPESREASRDGRDYMEQWLDKNGFKVVKSGADLIVEGNVFNAWEPHGAARYWGGWMANPGVGLEILVKDPHGKVMAEIRHKAKGSTIRDAVENGLEEVSKEIVKGK
jgi:hypothetical protein